MTKLDTNSIFRVWVGDRVATVVAIERVGKDRKFHVWFRDGKDETVMESATRKLTEDEEMEYFRRVAAFTAVPNCGTFPLPKEMRVRRNKYDDDPERQPGFSERLSDGFGAKDFSDSPLDR